MMSVLLARYFVVLGIPGWQAGLIGTSALIGTAGTTFLVGRYAERLGRRRLLAWGALLTALTGIAYAFSTSLVPLVLVAFFGTVNATSGDVSAFLPVEQAILGQVTSGDDRVRTFARFNVVGSLAGAAGAGASAAAGLLAAFQGLGEEGAVRWMLGSYALVGLATLVLVRSLPEHVELRAEDRRGGLGPSRRRVLTLSGLFATDSFAGGMVAQSIVALYLLREYNLDPGVTGAVFFGTSFLSAVSFLVSARLSTRFGLVNTMVFTHLPSNALLAGVAFAPNALIAVLFLLGRSILSQMDVPPRQTLVISVVEPQERAAAAAYTGLARSISSTPGPFAGGALLGVYGGAPFLVCGALKSTYDLALFALFRRVKPDTR